MRVYLLQCEQTGGDKDEREQRFGIKHPNAAKAIGHPTIKRARVSDENELGVQPANAMLIAVAEWPGRFAALHE